MPDCISGEKIEEVFTAAGYRGRQITNGWLVMRFPPPSWKYMRLDLSQGCVFWTDLKPWADEAGISQEEFES